MSILACAIGNSFSTTYIFFSNSCLKKKIFVAVQLLTYVRLFVTLWTAACQDVLSFTIFFNLLKFMLIEFVMLINHLILYSPLLHLSSNLSQTKDLFQQFGSSHQIAKVLEFQLQHQSFQWIFSINFLWGWLAGSPCSLMDSQESSPAPQFKGINSSALSLLYGPVLTSIHEYWKHHSFTYTDLCWQSNLSIF